MVIRFLLPTAKEISQSVEDLSGTSGIPISKRCRDSLNGREGGFRRAQANWEAIHKAADAQGIDPRVLGAIGVRETNFRDVIGADKHGRGVFQIDDRYHPGAVAFASDISKAANFAAGLIASSTNRYLKQGYSYELAVAGAVRNYNGGGGIPTSTMLKTGYAGYLDLGTTHNNYVSDVLGMAVNCF